MRIHNITRAQVMERMSPLEAGIPELWSFVQ